MTPDVNVILVDFAGPEREVVTHNEDDSYTIFINARLSDDGRIKAYEHAMRHINSVDFKKTDVQIIESVAHELPVEAAGTTQEIAPSSATAVEIQQKRCKRRKNRKREQWVKERSKFIMEHFDTFIMAEQQYLYGKNL